MLAMIEQGQGHAVYLRVHSFDGMRGSLVRYDFAEQGTNYLLLLADSRPGSGARVVDVFLATNGQRISESMGAVTQLLFNPSESLLGKLFGLSTFDRNLSQTLIQIGQLQRQGRSAEVYAKLVNLPDPIRNHRVMMNLSVQIASLVSEDAYRAELARLARYYRDDPTAAFALIDYYFYKGDTDSAMEAVLGVERAFGPDAAIAILKASVALEAGKLDAARKFAEESVALEPQNESSRWTLVGVLMPAQKYADGIRVLEGLERDFGYTFDDASFADNEVFTGFVKSREYAAWRARRN
jgi:tetratricopeptide (TPR) repeat protein